MENLVENPRIKKVEPFSHTNPNYRYAAGCHVNTTIKIPFLNELRAEVIDVL